MTGAQERYRESLLSIPSPGGGGCHVALLGVANRGIRAGLSEQDLFHDLRAAIPSGGRHVPDGEIVAAIRKAAAEAGTVTRIPARADRRPAIDGKSALRRVLDQGKTDNEADLWELSPTRIDWEPHEDAGRFLAAMYGPEELVFIGDRTEAGIIGENIRTAKAWTDFFQAGGEAGPFILINPLTGEPAPTKSGDGETFRGDGCIASFRYALAEFDELQKDQQIRFWTGAKLPIWALIDSGGKSVHAWLQVDISDADTWSREIRDKLYRRALIPIGIDSACQNPARLARLPGCRRGDQWQKILYLGRNHEH